MSAEGMSIGGLIMLLRNLRDPLDLYPAVVEGALAQAGIDPTQRALHP